MGARPGAVDLTGISANLGFLFREHKLPDAVRAAKLAGFDAVECHWPYDVEPALLRRALEETGLRMLCLNTSRGDHGAGEFGLAAVPGRQDQARAHIDEAIAYAAAIACPNIHVMAGRAEGETALATFADNLRYGSEKAGKRGIDILIEPLNTRDVPGYLLTDMEAARRVVEAVDMPNLKIMFDCYHMQIMRGDLLETVRRHMDLIGHVQFAGVPDRSEPDRGEVAYGRLLPAIREAGWAGAFGAEYRPATGSLDWLAELRRLLGLPA